MLRQNQKGEGKNNNSPIWDIEGLLRTSLPMPLFLQMRKPRGSDLLKSKRPERQSRTKATTTSWLSIQIPSHFFQAEWGGNICKDRGPKNSLPDFEVLGF